MKKKLGDVFEIGSGGTPSKTHPEYYGGDIPWVKTGDLKSEYLYEVEDFITEEGLNNSSAKMYESDTVLIAMYGATIGATSILNFPACTNQACAAFKKSEEILPEYLYFFLRSKKEKFVNDGVGGTQPNISAGYLKKVQIEVRSLDEQSEIINVLDKVNRIIDERTKELAALDDLIKARFVEMFGDINVNPLGWDTYNLDECFEIASSKRILKSEWKTEGIPFLRVRDVVQLVTTGKIDNDFFVSEEFYATLKDSDGIPKQGDVLVSATSTLGKCYIVKSGERFYFKDADVLRFRSKKNINPVFFVEQMKTQYIEKQIARTLGVTTVAHFTIKAAKTINMRLPDIDLQNQFADFVNQVNKSKVEIQQALEKTQLLFDSLMQQYFG